MRRVEQPARHGICREAQGDIAIFPQQITRYHRRGDGARGSRTTTKIVVPPRRAARFAAFTAAAAAAARDAIPSRGQPGAQRSHDFVG
jgi:hypothetical protein